MTRRPPLPAPSSAARKLLLLLLPLAGLLLAGLACNAPFPAAGQPTQTDSPYPLADAIMEEAGLSMEQALAASPEDRRQEVLNQLGPPDAFTLEWQELEDQTVRWEEWSYFDYHARFDFVDGELLWTLDIDPAPDGSVFAHAFDPLAYEAGMSIAEAKARVPDLTMTELPLDEGDIPGGVLLAGDQILMGFDQGQLVFVQTFMLAPEGEGSLPAAESSPTSAPSPTATAAPVALDDRFDDPSHTATSLFGQEYMDFSLSQGAAVMTAHHPGVLVATYDTPDITDFEATLTLHWAQTLADCSAGLVFRSDDPDGGLAFYDLVLVRPTDGYVALQQFRNGQLHEVKGLVVAQLANAQAGPITLTVSARGATIWVDVNEIPVFRLADTGTAEAGILGVAMVSPHDGDQVFFDEFELEALDD